MVCPPGTLAPLLVWHNSQRRQLAGMPEKSCTRCHAMLCSHTLIVPGIQALIVNGVFNGTSAGILLYMALVDLIAIDFFSARMRAAGPLVRVWH